MFPPIEEALDNPNGLLAMGGDLEPLRVIEAYRRGIFPWYQDEQPILWWSPDPRAILVPGQHRISRSLRRTMRRENFRLSINTAFSDVIKRCAALRTGSDGTWITDEMIDTYTQLHERGIAHSIEAWSENDLAGGLYGVGIDGVFSGESMFHERTDASKIAFVTLSEQLANWGWRLIDCQIANDHLESLGSTSMPRSEFKALLGSAPSARIETQLDWENSQALEQDLR